MQITLLRHTPEPEQALINAFSECYQKQANIKVIRKHLKHQSVLEHVSFTFQVKISRVAWEQMVRHRMASYTAQSHRYTDITEGDCAWYVPEEIRNLGLSVVVEWLEDAKTIFSIYKKWRERGVTKQTARYLAPKGVAIQATVTMNLRSLINFFSLRMDKHAQEEIRLVAETMYKLTMEQLPNLKDAFDELILEHCDPPKKE